MGCEVLQPFQSVPTLHLLLHFPHSHSLHTPLHDLCNQPQAYYLLPPLCPSDENALDPSTLTKTHPVHSTLLAPLSSPHIVSSFPQTTTRATIAAVFSTP